MYCYCGKLYKPARFDYLARWLELDRHKSRHKPPHPRMYKIETSYGHRF